MQKTPFHSSLEPIVENFQAPRRTKKNRNEEARSYLSKFKPKATKLQPHSIGVPTHGSQFFNESVATKIESKRKRHSILKVNSRSGSFFYQGPRILKEKNEYESKMLEMQGFFEDFQLKRKLQQEKLDNVASTIATFDLKIAELDARFNLLAEASRRHWDDRFESVISRVEGQMAERLRRFDATLEEMRSDLLLAGTTPLLPSLPSLSKVAAEHIKISEPRKDGLEDHRENCRKEESQVSFAKHLEKGQVHALGTRQTEEVARLMTQQAEDMALLQESLTSFGGHLKATCAGVLQEVQIQMENLQGRTGLHPSFNNERDGSIATEALAAVARKECKELVSILASQVGSWMQALQRRVELVERATGEANAATNIFETFVASSTAQHGNRQSSGALYTDDSEASLPANGFKTAVAVAGGSACAPGRPAPRQLRRSPPSPSLAGTRVT